MGIAFPSLHVFLSDGGVESAVEQARKCHVLIRSRLQKKVFSLEKERNLQNKDSYEQIMSHLQSQMRWCISVIPTLRSLRPDWTA